MFQPVAALGRLCRRASSTAAANHIDVLIIGGGVMGSSTAYWLKKQAGSKLNVCVIEKDMTFRTCSTALSVGGVRQQFSNPENIKMSLFGAKFVKELGEHLHVDGFPTPDVNFACNGYLVLASRDCVEILEKNSALQNALGAQNVLLSASQLASKFPWLNVAGIELGCLGTDNEGWFDPWLLLDAFKRKSKSLGAVFECGEVTNIKTAQFGSSQQATSVQVKYKSGEVRELKADNVVITAGAFSGQVAAMAGIGRGAGDLAVPLPVEPRKRYVYCFRCPEGPSESVPLTIDLTGTYFRREGAVGNYLCGRSPGEDEEPSDHNLDIVDHEFFEEQIWPVLANRVPCFESLKIYSSWAGFYDYNTIDQNAVIGRHPSFNNLYIATGFSGHGIQQGPAAGRAIKELILDGGYKAIDLTRLGFERFLRKEKVLEENIY